MVPRLDPLPQRSENGDCVERGEQVVDHHAKTILETSVEPPNGRRFENVKNSKSNKSGQPPKPALRDSHENHAVRYDLIPDDSAVIWYAQGLASDIAYVAAKNKEGHDKCYLHSQWEKLDEQKQGQPDNCTDGARCHRA